MKLFHTTSPAAAESIIAEGWRGSTGSYGFVETIFEDVVFLASEPVDINEGATQQGAVLMVEIDEAVASEWEIIEEPAPAGYHREFIVPASVLNLLDAPHRVE